MRKTALNILENEMSENTLRHIREIDYLEDWIVDAMINFHKSEVKKLNIHTINNSVKNALLKQLEELSDYIPSEIYTKKVIEIQSNFNDY